MKGQLRLSVEGLGGQGVEEFGRSEAFVSGLDHQLFLLDHMHELDPNECVLGCLERFASQHGPCHPLDGSMILLHDVVEVFHLTDDDGGAVGLVVALDSGFIGVAAVNRNFLGDPLTADSFLQKPKRRLCIAMLGKQKVNRLAVFVYGTVEIVLLALDLDVGLIQAPAHPHRTLAPMERLF